MNAHVIDSIDTISVAAEEAIALLSVVSDDLDLIAKSPCEKGISVEEIARRKSIIHERIRNSLRDSTLTGLCIERLTTILNTITKLPDDLKRTAE